MTKIITVPSSKSDFQRELIASFISNGESILHFKSISNDVYSCIDVLTQLGAKIKISDYYLTITPFINAKLPSFNFKESAFSLRVISVLLASIFEEFSVSGENTLLKRGQKHLIEVLQLLGKKVSSFCDKLPLVVSGRYYKSDLYIDCSSTSQVLSGLLFLYAFKNIKNPIHISNLNSKPYVEMTLDTLKKRGVEFTNLHLKKIQKTSDALPVGIETNIEGCWSSASFWFIYGALFEPINIKGLRLESKQADKAIMDILIKMGANIVITDEFIKVIPSDLKPISIDASDFPDLIPNLVVLCNFASGVSKISGIDRLSNKESDRAEAILTEFTKLGFNITKNKNQFNIIPSKLNSGTVKSYNDHRMVIAYELIAKLANNEVVIDKKNCVKKSYFNFYKDLKNINK